MKNELFILGFFLLTLQAYSQAPEIDWQKTIGGSKEDQLSCIAQTKDKGYIIGGSSFSNISGNKTENCRGDYDYWVIKLDSIGNTQWQKTIGGSNKDCLLLLKQSKDGGFIVGGKSNSKISKDKTENCQGDYDYWIIKLDAVGNMLWQNTIGGSGMDYFCSLSQTDDGGYVLGGFSTSNISDDKTENSYGDEDYWIVKLNSIGVIQWQKTIGGNESDMLTSINLTNDGGYILAGQSNSPLSGNKPEITKGKKDYWVLKMDVKGKIEWQKAIGGKNYERMPSIQQTFDGGYILGGSSKSNISGDKTEDSIGGHDYWVIKLNAKGIIQWQNTIGGSNDDFYCTINQTADGYIVGGFSSSGISGDKTEKCSGDFDYWVIKLDSTGLLKWQNTIGGSSDDRLISIQQTIEGGFIIAGISNSEISEDKTENCQGDYDYWIIKLGKVK